MRVLLHCLCLILAVSVSTIQAANTGSLEGLIQEYQYQMTIEWDQQDAQFAERAKNELLEGLEALKNQGMDQREVLNEIGSHLKNPDAMAEMEELRSRFETGSLSSTQFADKVFGIVKKDQMQGASWSGRTVTAGIIIALTAAWVAWTISLCRSSEGCDYLPNR